MPLKIYNSLTRTKEEFSPINPPEVKMYVCGPTVYDEPHIGHLRSAYVFDVMRRYLQFLGYQVRFVRNVTDVDDKIIEKAKEARGIDLVRETETVSRKYLNLYKADLTKLGILEPSTEPCATMHIQDMLSLIQKLLDKKAAYVSGGDVYFSVQAFKDYGALSHQKKDSMLEGVRIDPSDKKKEPLDFALWKASKEGEPSWDSPWGKGRPGWHIECSAMSMKYLGESFDIHGGGRDLIFPHHENEVAQSEAVTGKKFAKYWIHHGLITVNEQKMSKSLKNFITLTQLTQKDPEFLEDLKFLFLKTHYSAPLDYSESEMKMVRSMRNNFKFFFDEAKTHASGSGNKDFAKKVKEIFENSMSNDFNTPQVLSDFHEIMHAARAEKEMLVTAAALKECLSTLGLNFHSEIGNASEIEEAMRKRAEAKKSRNFKLADEIRDKYLKQGIEFVDTPNGTTWRKR